jgi:hypothetical protein
VGVAFLALAALLYFWRQRETAGAVVASLGVLLIVAAVALPARLGPVHRAWMGFARLISRVTTPIVMGVVFFIVVTPIGELMRLFGRRPLERRERDGGSGCYLHPEGAAISNVNSEAGRWPRVGCFASCGPS